MTDTLHDLLRDESQRIDVPPMPLDVIIRDGRRRRTVRRTRDAVAVAAAVAVVVGVGAVGSRGLLSDDAGPTLPAPAGTPSESPAGTPSGSPSDSPAGTPSAVASPEIRASGTGVDSVSFGGDADKVRPAIVDGWGSPTWRSARSSTPASPEATAGCGTAPIRCRRAGATRSRPSAAGAGSA